MSETEDQGLDLTKMSDETLRVVHRVAKTRLRAFFKNPKAMMALRAELERRGLK
jgi:hypothetical protein